MFMWYKNIPRIWTNDRQMNQVEIFFHTSMKPQDCGNENRLLLLRMKYALMPLHVPIKNCRNYLDHVRKGSFMVNKNRTYF